MLPELLALSRGPAPPAPAVLVRWLAATGADAAALAAAADEVRHATVGDAVHLRGLIEFSNHCRLNCHYCGIRRGNRLVQRYRLTPDEIVAAAGTVARIGCPTVVLQSGEDAWYTTARLVEVVRRIRRTTGLAITLSVGERPLSDYRAFRAAGADRYLLRFETADAALFASLHPDYDLVRRIACLEHLRAAGFQIGSGFLIGLPGGTLDTIAHDLLFATQAHLDMIGCGPFIAHPDTPLAGQPLLAERDVYFNTIALLRLLNPTAHLPATTAFDALCPDGRDRVLRGGGNVYMPNCTPTRYRRHYLLYPGKPTVDEEPEAVAAATCRRLAALGRPLATGPGHALRVQAAPPVAGHE